MTLAAKRRLNLRHRKVGSDIPDLSGMSGVCAFCDDCVDLAQVWSGLIVLFKRPTHKLD